MVATKEAIMPKYVLGALRKASRPPAEDVGRNAPPNVASAERAAARR
jgi:hypothetical protein